MGSNPWKFFSHLKEFITKVTGVSDKHTQNDLLQFFSKLPQPDYVIEYVKSAERHLSNFHQSIQEMYRPNVKLKAPNNRKKLWKNVKNISSSQSSMNQSVVIDLLESITRGSTDEQVLLAIEYLISHLKLHPEVRNNAVKLGAIRVLLMKRLKTTGDSVKAAAREALALLGYNDPVSGKGIRILSIDGGGIRGVLVLEMLKKLEELTGKRTYELFDFFCGVSTGAILTYSMGVHLRELDDIIARYEALSQEIFKQSTLLGTSKLMWRHAYYDTALWEKKLQDYLGDASLISTSRNLNCPKICVVSAVVNQSQVSAYVFRNYSLPWRFQSEYDGCCDAAVWQAARASAAAPTYFEEFRIGDLIHQDGGILVNNPTAIAIHEAKLLWPTTPIQCVVSFGTGRCIPSPQEQKKARVEEIGSEGTSWTNKFYKILDSATDTQAVHIMLSDLLPHNVYYRFNPYLAEMIGIVETDQEKHKQIKRDTLMYLRRNEDKFKQAAKTLVLEKSIGQKVLERMNLQRELIGI